MAKRRTDRLNSLLKEVISDVIHKEVKNPKISPLLTITRVDISKDLHHAKVYVSIIGEQTEVKQTMQELGKSSGFISQASAKKVVLRFFPKLQFVYDDSVDKHMRIEELLKQIHKDEPNAN